MLRMWSKKPKKKKREREREREIIHSLKFMVKPVTDINSFFLKLLAG